MSLVQDHTILKSIHVIILFSDDVFPICRKTCLNTIREQEFIVGSFYASNIDMTLLEMSFGYIYANRSIIEEKDVCELLDQSRINRQLDQ